MSNDTSDLSTDAPALKTLVVREVVVGSPEYAGMLELRDAVLRRPLGLRFTPAEMAREPQCVHLGGLLDGRVVATLLLEPEGPETVRMRQVAVAPELQGQGIGARLLAAAESAARARGFRQLTAHARATALKFYRQNGYAVEGEEFLEATIPHRQVAKTL